MSDPLSDATALLMRHPAAWAPGRLLVIDPPDPATVDALTAQADAVNFLIRDRHLWERITDPGQRCRFEPWWLGESPTRVLLYLPKGKEALEMGVAMAAALLPVGGELLVVGGNREGIKSAPRRLERHFGPVEKLEAARHCSLFRARLPEAPEPAPRLEEFVRHWPLQLGEERLTIASLPGVFNHGALDEGSQRLLEHLTLPPEGRLLDLGCGAGVIGALAARRAPGCQVELVDSSALAVAASRITLAENGIANAHVHPSDVFSATEGHYDRILSNPPFHSHVKTDYRVHHELVEGARRRLAAGGELHLVVNAFLKLRPLLEAAFAEVEVRFEDRRFRVFRAARPRS